LFWLQTPGPPFIPDEAGKGVNARIIFVQHGATLSSEDNLLMGIRDEAPSTLGEMQANKAAELLMDLKVGFTHLASPFSIVTGCVLHPPVYVQSEWTAGMPACSAYHCLHKRF
jgi:hypothetical protein